MKGSHYLRLFSLICWIFFLHQTSIVDWLVPSGILDVGIWKRWKTWRRKQKKQQRTQHVSPEGTSIVWRFKLTSNHGLDIVCVCVWWCLKYAFQYARYPHISFAKPRGRRWDCEIAVVRDPLLVRPSNRSFLFRGVIRFFCASSSFYQPSSIAIHQRLHGFSRPTGGTGVNGGVYTG